MYDPPLLLSINNFHYRRAGSDAAFLDHDRLFSARGWRTAVFSMDHRENLDSPWSHYFPREIELSRKYSAASRLQLASKVLYSFEARQQLERLIANHRPDVVHIHSIYHHISPSIFSALKRLKVPIVLTAHDYKLACPAYKMFDGNAICEECRGGRILPLLRKRCLHDSAAISTLVAIESKLHGWLRTYERHIDRIICPSRFMRRKLLEWGWPAEQLMHIPNFFDPLVWQPSHSAGNYFLYFGRLSAEKGVETLIRACGLNGRPLKIAGWGDRRAQLEALAVRTNTPVEFCGRMAAHELAELIRNARATVVPSEWYENASLAILESFACGKPVIATNLGGNPELVRDNCNGWLVNPGDAHALAECIENVWRMDDSQVEAHGRVAHAGVHDAFNSDRYYAAITDLYSDLGARLPALETSTARPQDACLAEQRCV